MLQPILLVGVLAVILSAVLAGRMAKRIVQPLNSLDLDHPLENDAYEELSPLLRRIQQQRRQINAQMQELQARTDEFEQITGSICQILFHGHFVLSVLYCVHFPKRLKLPGSVHGRDPPSQNPFGYRNSPYGTGLVPPD